MMMSAGVYNWETIQDFFDTLNEYSIRYVVMRNFEDMDNENFFVDGHEDLDILCEDVSAFTRVSKIVCKMIPEDDIHFVTFIAEKSIPVDLRHKGDNYYDLKWEEDVLSRRKMADNGNWYVMSEEDYYYTLVYHAILQKNEVNPQYIEKLNVMAQKLGVCAGCKEEHLKSLDRYMNCHDYHYVQPNDVSVPFQWEYIDHTQDRSSGKKNGMVKNMNIRKFVWGGGISFIEKAGVVSLSERVAI